VSFRNLFLVLFAAFLVAGCVPTKHHSRPSAGIRQFEDVPVPRNFRLLDTSYSNEGEGTRTASLKYYGLMHPAGVERFYRQVMPQLGWNLYDAQISGDGWERCLFFRKGRTVCVVSVNGSPKRTYLTIEIR